MIRLRVQLLPELYLHGLSTGDFDPALGWLLGSGAPLSATTIVRLKQQWAQEYLRWKERPLEKEYLYVWADGIYPKGGPIDESLCLLVVVGVKRTGAKQLLALAEGYRESEESWKEVFRDLKNRGVSWIGLIVGDGIKGLWKALREYFPHAHRQRCWVHKMRNVLDKVPDKAYDEVLAALREIYHAKSEEEARELSRAFVARYRPTLKGLAKMALYEWKHDKNIRNSILGTMKLVEIPKVFDKCPVPVLTMEAARELTWNTDKAEKLQNVFPGSRLVMFEHAGHAMFGDEPENFFSSLEEFIRKGQKVYKSASDLHDSAPGGFCGVDILLGNPKGR